MDRDRLREFTTTGPYDPNWDQKPKQSTHPGLGLCVGLVLVGLFETLGYLSPGDHILPTIGAFLSSMVVGWKMREWQLRT